jgi:predicted transcriptional regulator
MDHARRDLASASKTWVDSTSKFVQDKAPKVSATIDETLEKTSETFKRTIDAETKTQQVKLLRAYKSFLSRQVDVIEKRLERLKE